MPFLLLLCVLSLSLWSVSTDKLIAQAHDLNLSQSRYWHLLTHTPKNESEIDDPAFFLSSVGKSNLSSELDATITHFNQDVNQSDESPFCRFPARRAWLEKELNVSFGAGDCNAYAALVQKLDPQKVTLVFSSAHINSPASMFGHTFLRIDSSMDSKLMSYAINYAAQTDETSGVTFAYKGLFGGYSGQYSMLPYYEKLKEYRDSEARDVWEYDLNLTPQEVQNMVRHIWELQNINSEYYFFNENCSYHMLWLSEVARPNAHLREYFTYHVIPPETVRAFEQEGLVKEKHFRPSKRTKLLAYEKALSPKGVIVAYQMAGSDEAEMNSSDFSVLEQQYILESSAELVEYDYIQGTLSKDAYARRYHALLSRRAALGAGEVLSIQQKPNPDTAHPAARISLSQGWYSDRSPFLLGWRPALNDLSEDDTGYLMGAQIEFLDTLISLDQENVRLEKLTLLSLSSITPASRWFKPFSWRMKSGWDHEYNDENSFVTRVGAGASVGEDGKWLAYILSEPELRVTSHWEMGLGISAGGVIEWPYRQKTQVEGSHFWYTDASQRSIASFSHHYQWNLQNGFYCKYGYEDNENVTHKYTLGINLYF